MRIFIEMGHPAHVHHFKNLIRELENRGHQITICAMDKDVTIRLLQNLGFEYELLGTNLGKNLLEKASLILRAEYRMYRAARRLSPDLFISRCSPISAHVSRIVGKPHISFNDTEHTTLSDALAVPFTEAICIPSCFMKTFGGKEVYYDGYKELAYLHPDRFTPDPEIVRSAGIQPGERFALLRLISWSAHHDFAQRGIDDVRTFVERLGQEIRVVISSEKKLPRELEVYRSTFAPEEIHHVLYFADLYLGEGATMATEAAVLGTPSIYISSLAGTMGNFLELEKRYQLLYCYKDPVAALEKGKDILHNPASKEEWAMKRKRLLETKIDVTRFMTWFIDGYPQSHRDCIAHPRNEHTSRRSDTEGDPHG